MIEYESLNELITYDQYRQTGRTNRMLLEATRTFLCQYNVLVTAHSMTYARDLCSKVKNILWALGITDFTSTNESISAFGSVMIFRHHDYDTKGQQFDYVYMDHYQGRMK